MQTTSATTVHPPNGWEWIITPESRPAQLHCDTREEENEECFPVANHAAASGVKATKRILAGLVFAGVVMLPCHQARASQALVFLGSATTFGVLANATLTSVDKTSVIGDLGVAPGTAVAGFPPGKVSGTIHAGDPDATQAQADLTTAYNDAAGRTLGAIEVAGNIGGQTFPPGLYFSSSSLAVSSGNLTLDAQGDAQGVWIFQMGSTLTTISGTQVILTNGAQASNIFWQVGSSATLGTSTIFQGTIMAKASITMQTGATLYGRALAQNGAVALDANTIIIPLLPPPPSFGPISRASDGSVTLLITNTPSLILTLQSSTDLTNWTTFATPIPSASPYTLTDTTASAAAVRFYRAFYP
jgi:type VI secretion system secreted protein VgrG